MKKSNQEQTNENVQEPSKNIQEASENIQMHKQLLARATTKEQR